ncbi:hypothetical protein EDB81DRAFT_897874 [Dactylonectria macrodidyma]|uniref:Altered inheritance of mitochondria protein 11 n=1 Tax=Dactylonectria macrodidyma TaxID=307937 RepID=A0A9P9JNX7_9HYPO|nr:hypothetical protein EDB81DRAFT_897874 [Dactylonectria macrodidyma]
MSGLASSPAPQTTTNNSGQDTPRQDAPPVPSWTRALKQFGFLSVGAGLLAASVAVSRRAVTRRRLAAMPKFYSSNRAPIAFDSADRSALAAHALSLATLNVMAFGVMLVAGVGWSFDLSSIEELKTRTRVITRRPGVVNPEDEAEMKKVMEDLMGRIGMEKPASSGMEENEAKKD